MQNDWTAAKRIPLETNLDVIRKHYPALYEEILARAGTAIDYRISKTQDGTWVLSRQVESDIVPIHTAEAIQQEHIRVEAAIAALQPTAEAQVVYLLGLDFGFTLDRLVSYMAASPYTAVVVVEPDIELFMVMMAARPMEQFLSINRCMWVVGDDWLDQLENLFDARDLFGARQVKVVLTSMARHERYAEAWRRFQQGLKQFTDAGKARLQSEIKSTIDYYSQKDRSRVRSVMAPFHSEGMAARFIQQRFLDECKRLDVAVFDYHQTFVNEVSLLRAIARQKPDALLLVNRCAGDFVPSGVLDRIPIPRMVWCIDDPNSFIKDPFSERDIVFTWDEHYDDDLKNNGAAEVDFFPYVADLDGADARVRDEFISPVSYIGQVKAFDREEYGLDEKTAALVQFVAQRKFEEPKRSYQSHLLEHQGAYGLRIINDETETIPRFVRYAIYTVSNALRRVSVLERVMPFGLKIYGGNDWLAYLGGHPLRECFCGPADPQKDVPDIFVSSTINLNIHSLQALTSLNQRDFNCPLVGGFLLTDWVDCADRFFAPDEEMVFYHSLDDLAGKVEHYLKHDEERKAVIEKGRGRVLREHTYAARVPNVLRTLERRIQERFGR